MKGDASVFVNKAQGRVKTRQGSHSRRDLPPARVFQPYRARDRPVSDYPKRVGKRHSGESRDGVQRRVRASRGATESEIGLYPIVR